MSGIYDEVLIALHGVWNRRWLALAVAWGVCMAGWLVVALIPNAYESKAKDYVQMQSILPDKVGITTGDQQKSLDQVRNTLTSAGNLEKVVRGTDLNQGISGERDVAGKIGMLKANIKVVQQLDPNMFEISAKMSDTSISDGANARLTTQIVQKLIDIFEEDNIAGDRDETRQSLTFLDGQIAARGKQLQAADQRRVEFDQKYLGILPGAGSIGQRMDAARTEINTIDSQLIQAQSALSAMNGQLAGTPATIAGPAVPGGNGSLGSINAQIAQAKARGWTDNHPDVVALRAQAAAAARNPVRGGGGGGTPNPTYTSLKSMQAERSATVSALQARKNQIQSDLATMQSKQVDEPGVASEQERLNRDYDAIKTQYDKLLADREDVRLRGDVQSETNAVQFRVIDPPSAPNTPASPNRPLLLIAVLVVGIGAGVGAAFAMGQLQGTYPTAARLEKAAGLPVVGSITETLTAAQSIVRKQRMKWFAGASSALAGVCLLLVAVEFVQRGMA